MRYARDARLLSFLAVPVGMMMMLTIAGCADSGIDREAPPAAEFLLAAGDSTYWVQSDASGIRVRSAPILLTNIEGQFYEIFVAEDRVEYADASFGTSQVWGRSVSRGDSVLLFEDSTVLRQAARWKRRHPREQPLETDDDRAENPRTTVDEAIEIVDVHGPWLTFTHLLDVDTETGESHLHTGRHLVVDVRSGQPASLQLLFGDTVAATLLSTAHASFARLTDSIRTAVGERAAAARASLHSFSFDSSSFAITDIDRVPAVSFMVPGTGSDGEALSLYLPPIGAATPAWWSLVRATLPVWAQDSSDVRWARGTYDIFARPYDDDEILSVFLQRSVGLKPGERSREWPVARVGGPVYELLPLDTPAVDAPTRAALARAFDRSTALDGLVQRASRRIVVK